MLSSFLRTVPQSQANQTISMQQVRYKHLSSGNNLNFLKTWRVRQVIVILFTDN